MRASRPPLYTEPPPPGTPDTSFNNTITAEVQKAIDAIKQIHDLDIVEKTRVNASEFAHGGYTKVQKALGKAVNEKVNQKFRANKDPDVINWIDAGSSAELPGAQYSPGAASWVTTGPRNPNLTLLDDDFLLAFRTNMMLPIALAGSTCAYRPSSTRVACAAQLDALGRHAHSCAKRVFSPDIVTIANDICTCAREAGLRARTEQFAAEIPPHLSLLDTLM